MTNDTLASLPFLQRFDAEARRTIAAQARLVDLPAGTRVFEAGQSAQAFLIVLAGSVRVHLTAANGREIVLYRVEAGESCVLTTSCLMENEAYSAEALCETQVQAVALPKGVFRSLLAESASFRDTVLSAYASRVADLILTIEETQFQRIDARLAQHLATHAIDGVLRGTHQDLAVELGTAREVISRTLKRFERTGAIDLQRGAIVIRNDTILARHADGR
jgi:CRP/FNR family transcriptional regulator